MKPRILIVDDEPDICRALELLLKREGADTVSAGSGEAALELLGRDNFDIVITDLKMGKLDGMAVLEKIRESRPGTAVIMMTAFASIETAVEALKKGAHDYIVKPFLNEEIRITVKRALEQKRLVSENEVLKRQVSQRYACREFIANSEAMLGIMETLEKVIPTKSNILILGESGTGKGLLAELIHCNSPRKDKPFISINCSAIPEGLLESELFGYRKGAFTGAVSDKTGLIAMADEGTLFLDEIGDMPVTLQAKLLKVLETGIVQPLGDTKTRTVDLRVLSATNVDIENRLKDGKFREDLYWRLNVIELKMPSLKERKDDIEVLAKHFMSGLAKEHGKTLKGFQPEALSLLLSYAWPGNVRELKNVIERSVVLSSGETITPKDLPDKLKKEDRTGEACLLKVCLGDFEKNLLARTYNAHGRNKEETARALGIDLATLYRKFKKYGIEAE